MAEIGELEGLQALWSHTEGASDIRVAVLDSPVDLEHPALRGGNIRQLPSYCPTEPEDSFIVRAHGTYVASVIGGSRDADMTSVAPGVEVVSIPVVYDLTTALDPYNLAASVDLAVEANANVIHFSACYPTVSGASHDALERSVQAAIQRGILVVAPAGNNWGELACLAAASPNVLAVGCLNDDGKRRPSSNWGGPGP